MEIGANGGTQGKIGAFLAKCSDLDVEIFEAEIGANGKTGGVSMVHAERDRSKIWDRRSEQFLPKKIGAIPYKGKNITTFTSFLPTFHFSYFIFHSSLYPCFDFLCAMSVYV